MSLIIDSVAKRFARFPALNGVSLTAPQGAFVLAGTIDFSLPNANPGMLTAVFVRASVGASCRRDGAVGRSAKFISERPLSHGSSAFSSSARAASIAIAASALVTTPTANSEYCAPGGRRAVRGQPAPR